MEPGEQDDALTRRPAEPGGEIVKPGNLFDALPLSNIRPEQQEQLIAKVVEHKIDLDAAEKSADRKYVVSGREMRKTIDQIQALESATRADYTLRADYETASGRTTLEVKKNTRGLIIIIAIIAAIAFLMLLRGG